MALPPTEPAPACDAAPPPDRPLVSMLLIAYHQQATVAEAIAGALAQTYSPLEILVSDDASGDGTWAAMQAAVAGYTGPHRVVLNRNPHNLGIGAHLSMLAARAQGELLFVAAGDDVSLPERCERCVAAWLAEGRRRDLIACPAAGCRRRRPAAGPAAAQPAVGMARRRRLGAPAAARGRRGPGLDTPAGRPLRPAAARHRGGRPGDGVPRHRHGGRGDARRTVGALPPRRASRAAAARCTPARSHSAWHRTRGTA